MNVNDLFCTVYGTQVKCMQTNRNDDAFKRKTAFLWLPCYVRPVCQPAYCTHTHTHTHMGYIAMFG